MIFHDVQQNTDEWDLLRLGKITSSKLGVIMANNGKAFSDTAKKYAVQLALEQLTNEKSKNGFSNAHTERGHEQEPLARMEYEARYFCNVTNGGFFCGGDIGCSPDGLVDEDGVIEIKSVIAPVHFANVKRGNIDPAYNWQCIGNVWLTGRDYLDFVSYCQDFPEGKRIFVKRIFAKNLQEEFQLITNRVQEFKYLLRDIRQQIVNSEYSIAS